MARSLVDVLRSAVNSTIDGLTDGFIAFLPRLVSGLLFLTIAYLGIRIVLRLARAALDRVYAESHDVLVSLFVTVLGVFLWFGAILALLKIVGMGDVAASLGTATGFVALGVSYALSDMIADTVSGVYLLRDPDFAPGMEVSTNSIEGTVESIELRKSRIRTPDGDTVIIANRDVEKRWTRRGQ